MGDYHEKESMLPENVRDMVRAVHSLREEIDAMDWYQQRIPVCHDEELKKVLEHNRREEIEHSCMLIEWLRRNDPQWDEKLNNYLFTEKSIVEVEEETED